VAGMWEGSREGRQGGEAGAGGEGRQAVCMRCTWMSSILRGVGGVGRQDETGGGDGAQLCNSCVLCLLQVCLQRFSNHLV
jgi:hypothetical protein